VDSGKNFCPGCGARIKLPAPDMGAIQTPVPAPAATYQITNSGPDMLPVSAQQTTSYMAAGGAPENAYTPVEPIYTQHAIQPPPVDAASAAIQEEEPASQAKTMSFPRVLINLLIMSIPLVGFIVAVILSFGKKNAPRKNLARAMIVISALWHAAAVAGFYVWLYTMRQIAEVVEFSLSIFGIKII